MAEKLMVPGFKHYGGKHCETTAANHVLRYQGIELSEEMLFGIGGGIGFIYWFMKQMPAPLVGGRAGGREFNLIDNIVRRIGGSTRIQTTGSAKKSFEWLVDDLESNRPVVCYGDIAYLPYFGVDEKEHFGGHVFVVYGIDPEGDKVWIADRGTSPFYVRLDDLARSRGSKHPPFPPHNMTLSIDAPERCCDLAPGIRESIRNCIDGMENPPIGNFGLQGILKWSKKVLSWPTEFTGRSFVDCLVSLFLYIELGGTGGSAFRTMYAQFLREASETIHVPALGNTADQYVRCADQWSNIAHTALNDDIKALSLCKQILLERSRLTENNDDRTASEVRELNIRLEQAIGEGADQFDVEQKTMIVEVLHKKIETLHDLEKEALASLSESLA